MKKIENEKLNEQCITGKSGSGCAYTDKMTAMYDENVRDIEET
ncbi:MAG: hypothetical protein UHN47_03500 [Lachnospiraceae bacterium]|nr:hypothetical protein [Lachnospiraceae bacterium]